MKRAAKQRRKFDSTTIGLLGGSFNPPHVGHVHITHQALRAFGFNKIWWLVTPGNPLKTKRPVSIEMRVKECKRINQSPKVVISDIENDLNSYFTADTLRKLFLVYPNIRFVWLMGADNLTNFHKWDKWTWIMENIPVGVLARPGEQIKAGSSKTAFRYRKYRIKPSQAAAMPFIQPPAWALICGPMQDVSSTEIRSIGRK